MLGKWEVLLLHPLSDRFVYECFSVFKRYMGFTWLRQALRSTERFFSGHCFHTPELALQMVYRHCLCLPMMAFHSVLRV